MENPKNKENSEEWLKNLPTQSDNPAFSDAEMISCGKCSRNNPPNRLKCLYCGNELEISDTQAKMINPRLRKMEPWENGFNLVCLPTDSSIETSSLTKISEILNIDAEILQQTFNAEISLPLARAESEREANIVAKRLAALGIEIIIVSDDSLNIKNSPKRLRGIEFLDDKIRFTLFNEAVSEVISIKDIALIVVGKVFERKVEAVEQRSRKGDNKILQAAETAFDESLIDIYGAADKTGFRILEKGFDFSCLGAEKELFAAKNMPKLIAKLRTIVSGAKFFDDYVGVREALGSVWEIESRTATQGFHRKGFGSVNMENLSTANNLTQFTKYSRMQRQLI